MANIGIITGATTRQRYTAAGTTQLALTLSTGAGVVVAGNQFTVASIGQYTAEVTAYPSVPNLGFAATLQIFNATSAAVVGSEILRVPTPEAGLISQRVLITFPVTNVAHVYQLRIVIPSGVHTPNVVSLETPAANTAIFQMVVRSIEGARDSGIYGDGSDGDVTLAASAPIARDMYYNNLTIAAAQVLTTAGFRVFVRDTLTFGAASSIVNTGGAGATAAAGGAAGAAGAGQTVGVGFIGGAGGAGAGNAGTNSTTSMGGAGGLGGAGNGGGNAGGAGGTVTAPTPIQGGIQAIRAMPHATSGNLVGTNAATMINGGGGGGAGGGSGAATSGGGGGGAGIVIVAAREFTGTGSVTAVGGAGGLGGVGLDQGGGGGGGGGAVITVSDQVLPATVTTSVLGGAGGGGGGGGGTAGADGAAGTAVEVKLGA